MANNQKGSSTVKRNVEKSEPKQEVPVKTKNETVEIVESYVVEPEMDFLLSILLDANKDLKINDQIIYNKLDLFLYEPDKRKFYQLLIGTELFASNKDAIIICGTKTQAADINTKANNEELYLFLNEEFGIDKMVYGIDEGQKRELIEMYKSTPVEDRNKPVYIEKYKIEKQTNASPEDKLKDLFGDSVKIED